MEGPNNPNNNEQHSHPGTQQANIMNNNEKQQTTMSNMTQNNAQHKEQQ